MKQHPSLCTVTRRLLSFFVIAALLSACAPVEVPSAASAATLSAVRLSTDNSTLKNAATRALKAGGVAVVTDDNAPWLVLRETSAEKIANIASDGSIGAYLVTYSVYYRFDGGEEKRIIRERTINHSESRYLAGRQQRSNMINSLRRNALTRLRYVFPGQ